MQAFGKYGEAFTFRVKLWDYSNPDIISSPTIAAGDFKVKIDGGAENNLTNTPSASGIHVTIALTAAEMTGQQIQVVWRDSATKEWLDDFLDVLTWGHASALYPGVPADIVRVNGNASVAAFEAAIASIRAGTVNDTAFTPTTTQFDLDGITESQANAHSGKTLRFTSGALAGLEKTVSASSLQSGRTRITLSTALPSAPVDGVGAVIF